VPPTKGFPDQLGDDANDNLNRHSAFENEKGGHYADLEALRPLSLRIEQILYHLAAPGKSADTRCASVLAANMLAEWQPAGIIPLALRSSSPLPASPYLAAYQ
jgi:hypothetical protein